MSQDIKALISNTAPYQGMLPMTSVNASSSPSAFNSITSTFKFEHHNGTDSGLELKVLKYIMIREGLVMNLTHACDKLVRLSDRGIPVNNELKSEILDGLSQIRDTTVELIEIICMWRLSSADNRPDLPIPFIWEGQNYVLKIVSDLNFMGNVAQLVELLSISPYKMVLNPLMLPNTLIEGDLWIGPEDRASFDAGGQNEGAFFQQRLQLRRAERVLLQEIEVYDTQIQMGMGAGGSAEASAGAFPLGSPKFDDYDERNDSQYAQFEDMRPVSQGASGQGTRPLPMSSSSRNVHSAAPTTGGAVAGAEMGLDDWGFSSGADAEDGIIYNGVVGDDSVVADSGIIFTDMNGRQSLNMNTSDGYGFNPPPDYLRASAERSNSRNSSRQGSRSRQNATSRIRGLPQQPLGPVATPGSQSPAYDEKLQTRDPVDTIRVVSRDFTGLEQYNTGVPGHGRAKAHNSKKSSDGNASGSSAGQAPSSAPKNRQKKKADSSAPTPEEMLEPISTYDVEMIVSMTNPPPQLILAAAAVVILLEEGQEYPNDVTWNSFLSLATYTDLAWEMNNLAVGMIPRFKIRAIRPFLDNMMPLQWPSTNSAAHTMQAGPESDEFPPAPVTDDTHACISKLVRWVLIMTDTTKLIPRILPAQPIPRPSAVTVARTEEPAAMTATVTTTDKKTGAAAAGSTSKSSKKKKASAPTSSTKKTSRNTNPVLEMPPKGKVETASGKAKAGTSGGADSTNKANMGKSSAKAVTPKVMGPPPKEPHPKDRLQKVIADETVKKSFSRDEYDDEDFVSDFMSGPAPLMPSEKLKGNESPLLSARNDVEESENASAVDGAYGDEDFEDEPVPAPMGLNPSDGAALASVAPVDSMVSTQYSESFHESTTMAENSSLAKDSSHSNQNTSIIKDESVISAIFSDKDMNSGSIDKSLHTEKSAKDDEYGDDFIGSSVVQEESVMDVANSGTRSQVAGSVATEDYGDEDFEA